MREYFLFIKIENKPVFFSGRPIRDFSFFSSKTPVLSHVFYHHSPPSDVPLSESDPPLSKIFNLNGCPNTDLILKVEADPLTRRRVGQIPLPIPNVPATCVASVPPFPSGRTSSTCSWAQHWELRFHTELQRLLPIQLLGGCPIPPQQGGLLFPQRD